MSGTRTVTNDPAATHALLLRGVTKRFKKRTIRAGEYTTFKSELIRLFRGQRRKKDGPSEMRFIEALRGIDLEIPRGKTVGILGRNGSGKSTLLKLITGIYTPSGGEIHVNGRISALLDLGAGFHPDFSGRENILINGIILGMTRAEVRERMDQIIAFSELGEFIDEPVRTYSSGMFMRLAFAVATHVDPEILIIDEILAVGDEHFGKKSRAKMDEFKRAGKTIVLVTHDLGTVEKWCDFAAWIDGGRIRRVGAPTDVVAEYRAAVTLAEETDTVFTPPALAQDGGALPQVPTHAAAPGPDQPSALQGPAAAPLLDLTRVVIVDPSGTSRESFDPESPLEIRAEYVSSGEPSGVNFGFRMSRDDGTLVYETSTDRESVSVPSPLSASGSWSIFVERVGLLPGQYVLDVFASKAGVTLVHQSGAAHFRVASPVGDTGLMRPAHRWSFGDESAKRAENAPVRLKVS